jgi:hypothetical protein
MRRIARGLREYGLRSRIRRRPLQFGRLMGAVAGPRSAGFGGGGMALVGNFARLCRLRLHVHNTQYCVTRHGRANGEVI